MFGPKRPAAAIEGDNLGGFGSFHREMEYTQYGL